MTFYFGLGGCGKFSLQLFLIGIFIFGLLHWMFEIGLTSRLVVFR